MFAARYASELTQSGIHSLAHSRIVDRMSTCDNSMGKGDGKMRGGKGGGKEAV